MRRQVITGAETIDALPHGEYAACIPGSRFETHQLGRLPLPPFEPYGIHNIAVTAALGVFKFIGLGHADRPTPRLWEWISRGEGYTPIDGPTSGYVIYNPNGKFIDFDPAGYAFWDDKTNAPVSRLVTSSAPFNGISQWVKVSDLYIGQGHDSIAPPGAGGVIIWDSGKRVWRKLDDGNCSQIHARNDGNAAVVSYIKSGVGGVILWLTMDELRNTDIYTPTTKPPVDPPKPPNPPEPPMPVLNMSNALAIFHREWNNSSPIIDDAEKHNFTAAFAKRLGGLWGRKSRAGDGQPISKDTIAYWLGSTIPISPTDGKMHAFDLISSSGQVSWDTRAENGDPGYNNIDARWWPVSDVVDPPKPPDNPPAPDMVLDAIAAMRADITTQHAAIANAMMFLSQRLADLEKVIADRPAPTVKFPPYVGKLGTKLRLTPEVEG